MTRVAGLRIAGHEYTPENTCISQGGRKCRTCHRDRERIRARERRMKERTAA